MSLFRNKKITAFFQLHRSCKKASFSTPVMVFLRK
ncbi:hypothetical protein NT05LI_0034, partial [Listeria ivanovii FSL F6-596]